MSVRVRFASTSTFIMSVAWLTAIKARLRLTGFRRTVAYARTRRLRVDRLGDAHVVIAQATRAMATAGAVYPGRARCLEQSLALQCVLRGRGVDVALRIGVQPYRFQAHAWIEYAGTPITDSADKLVGMALLPEIPA